MYQNRSSRGHTVLWKMFKINCVKVKQFFVYPVKFGLLHSLRPYAVSPFIYINCCLSKEIAWFKNIYLNVK